MVGAQEGVGGGEEGQEAGASTIELRRTAPQEGGI
jgi:hypothetical protein